MKRLFAAVIVCVLALVGCGGSSTPQPGPKQTVVAHPCNPANYTMQCGLKAVPAPSAPQESLLPALHGIDFAWTKFGPSFAGDFGASYISHDPSKDWTKSLIDQYHAAHKGTVAVFETTANRAAAGCAAGAADARFSEAVLNGWGFKAAHFDMAVDFDANPGDVSEYFRCANAAEPGLVGAYGSALIVNYLSAKGYAHKSWPTYAWLYRTGGVWPSVKDGPLRQVLNGNEYDHDIALAADYGQFPTPIIGESAAVKHARAARESAFKQYRAHGCKFPQQNNFCRHAGASVVSNQLVLWHTYKRWACFGRGAKTSSEVCWIVRPQAAFWSHARDASRRAFDSHVCGGATGTQGLTPDCRVWKQRVNWFGSRASSLVKAFS